MDEVLHNGSLLLDSSSLKQDNKNIKAMLYYGDPQHTPLKIGICGADHHLVREIGTMLSRLIHIPHISSVIDMAQSRFTNGDVAVLVAWLAQFYEQIELRNFISSETSIDIVARLLASARMQNEETQKIAQMLENLTGSVINSQYAVMFYIPSNTGYNAVVDKHISDLLNDNNVDYLPLLGEPQEMVKNAIEYLAENELIRPAH